MQQQFQTSQSISQLAIVLIIRLHQLLQKYLHKNIFIEFNKI